MAGVPVSGAEVLLLALLAAAALLAAGGLVYGLPGDTDEDGSSDE